MYRLYFRDGVNRRIVSFREVQASSDEEAKAASQPFLDDHHRVELWLGERLVATLSPAR